MKYCSSEESDDSEPDDNIGDQGIFTDAQSNPSTSDSHYTAFESLFPSMEEVYGTMLIAPCRRDTLLYKRFAKLGRNANCRTTAPGLVRPNYLAKCKAVELLLQPGYIPSNTSVSTKPPRVLPASVEVYKSYCERGIFGAGPVPSKSMTTYLNFVKTGARENCADADFLGVS